MFRRVVWFTIAGVLLLGQTSGWAESYLRVRKNGVTFYYFNSRESSPPSPGGRNSTPGSKVPLIPPIRLIPSEKGDLSQGPAPSYKLSVKTDDRQVLNPGDTKAYLGAGARYLVGLLTKLGYRCPPAPPVSKPGHRSLEGPQPGLSIRETAAAAGGDNFLKNTRTSYSLGGQGKQGLNGGNHHYYCFPVAGPFSFRNSWSDYRGGGRQHRAVDIFAREGTPVYAVTAGVVDTLVTWPRAGITLLLQGQDGRLYGYMHLLGYAPGIVEGKRVRGGALLGYVGRTGVWRSPAHLHFQVYANHRRDRDNLLNPYYFLVQLCHGTGVTDLFPQKIARLEDPKTKFPGYNFPGIRGPQLHSQ